jgi:hypothetical protein
MLAAADGCVVLAMQTARGEAAIAAHVAADGSGGLATNIAEQKANLEAYQAANEADMREAHAAGKRKATILPRDCKDPWSNKDTPAPFVPIANNAPPPPPPPLSPDAKPSPKTPTQARMDFAANQGTDPNQPNTRRTTTRPRPNPPGTTPTTTRCVPHGGRRRVQEWRLALSRRQRRTTGTTGSSAKTVARAARRFSRALQWHRQRLTFPMARIRAKRRTRRYSRTPPPTDTTPETDKRWSALKQLASEVGVIVLAQSQARPRQRCFSRRPRRYGTTRAPHTGRCTAHGTFEKASPRSRPPRSQPLMLRTTTQAIVGNNSTLTRQHSAQHLRQEDSKHPRH